MSTQPKLNARQQLALKEISRWDGRYSIYWTTKSRELLERLGYVAVVGQRVRITDAGKVALEAL